jgi:thiaminase
MLRDGCEPAWSGLADHPFVRRLADGTLEPLADIFRTGVRLERGFWDMAFGLADWSKTPSDI